MHDYEGRSSAARKRQIPSISYVNTRPQGEPAFFLRVVPDFETFSVFLNVRHSGEKKRSGNWTIEFPHVLTRADILAMEPTGQTRMLLGEADALGFSPHANIRGLAAFLAERAQLQIGFYHDDIERELFEEREWFVDEDQDDGHCACIFTLHIGNFRTEWLLSPDRVNKTLTCTREHESSTKEGA